MKNIIIASAFLGVFSGLATSAFAGYFNTAPISRCQIQITSTLQVGSENADVVLLQQMLSRGGYFHVISNGYFGPATFSAVQRFQAENGLVPTGSVNEATRNAVNERLCDSDVRGDTSSYDTYNMYGYSDTYDSYSTGITYVDPYDAYVKVVTPAPAAPQIYSTPQADLFSNYNNRTGGYAASPASPGFSYSNTNYASSPAVTSPTFTINNNPVTNQFIPSTTSSGIQSTNIIYSPSIGYTYGIVPTTGSLTITTPLANSLYKEGDTVNLAWTLNNINSNTFQISLENSSTNQSKIISLVNGNSASFTLTKELLDAVCAGACDNNQQGTFKFVVGTRVTDIAGINSTLRAVVSPVTIRRPYSVLSSVSLTTSKTPVNSGEGFRLYVNTPGMQNLALNSSLYNGVTIRLRATCVNAVQVSVAGVPCGQDFTMPISTLSSEQGIPTMITNPSWFKQEVVFDLLMVNSAGQTIGASRANVTVNAAPINW